MNPLENYSEQPCEVKSGSGSQLLVNLG